ncbi:unnamed protein product [Caenorhabditis angaria]|uniref:Alpha-1,3-mannosyl-glycoprotein 2-beta-N-acetylglucosaminyltransferase n=1 Tax=Caenorhabditis angaria TaxID=860376 RepID=A0A9P1J0F6_9PELO|nr:unnamed protein product [Caenorhabditis angaria]
MKRVFRRVASKYSSTFFKIISILTLLCLILYLKSADSSIVVEQPRKAKFSDYDEFIINRAKRTNDSFIAAVLVICATRADALKNHLTQLLSQRPSPNQYHVIISQDGNTDAVQQTAISFVNDFRNVTFMQHERIATKKRDNYPAISAHYKWALDKLFFEKKYDHVIITEDDLDIGNDFFSFFEWGKRILLLDKTIWCISAWNDNGAPNLIDNSKGDLVWRTDFFPGLGWMLTKEIWAELSEQFPISYWDDWMRKPEVRKNRSCIRPEISRTSHNMRLAGKGSSGGMFKDFLSKIGASKSNTDFSLLPASIVEKSNYNKHLIKDIKNSKAVDISNASNSINSSHTYKISYKNVREWNNLAKFFKIMTDIRGGMQRTAYYGVVTVIYQETRVYLVPASTFENPDNLTEYKYDADWDKQNRFIEFENHYCKTKKYIGKCDPHDPAMIAFFTKKGWKKRLSDWGEMIVV